ncbi:transcription factor BIM2 isoform X2 [Capsicum annuum]|uniref:transcription factor BIM2 isoform X2 n=1 Tax=Capsicum annuum TaxID=4072 RepID=UPI0007BFA739|nr:transcription factor BIM2 isoform X2 [Capsicum annuum]XP_047269102.1 transcription factor BIM2 isoform X2 [Capsicum annuum]XP_047269103.1 transcription factor BIM2 isoform X2 [Capsicum annuum]
MKRMKGHQEEEEAEEDDACIKKDATPSSSNTKAGKNNDKASALRTKHSVTEQRRRCKINERFQALRNLIPHTNQKRDTASFLLEVIQYVQFLQDKVQKYEGSYQPWSSEPTKLMPWRNSHWHMQSLPVQPHALKNGIGPESTYLGRGVSFKSMDQQNELANNSITTTIPLQSGMPMPMPNNSAFSEPQPRPVSDQSSNIVDALNHREDLAIDGGTISISTPYSEGLLDSVIQALLCAGIDLSEATISTQINFGNRANQGMTPGPPIAKDNENPTPSGKQHMDHFREASSDEDLEQAQKRLKI